MKLEEHPEGITPWLDAVGLVERWLGRSERSDELLERAQVGFGGVERARVQHLVLGVLRHHGRIAHLLQRHMKHPPRDRVLAVLQLGGFELVEAYASEDPVGNVAKVVHHAVERSKSLMSKAEQKLVNAVLRRLAEELQVQKAPPLLAQAHVLADYFSHPEWMVKRWLALFGAKATRSLLEWNQSPSPVYLRERRAGAASSQAGIQPTVWPLFFRLDSGHWRELAPLVEKGDFYVQDPSTRRPIELLDPKAGESVLDLCASPGGKSLACADRMGAGLLVAVDLPGQRLERLQENLRRIQGLETHLVEADIAHNLAIRLQAARVPQAYDAVLLDAPCSNTGVMRHRVDVKDRLDEEDLAKHGRQQFKLLCAAALAVKPQGRLVYSTCSIDPEENEDVVNSFLRRNPSWRLVDQALSKPWSEGHDGGAAFLLRRRD